MTYSAHYVEKVSATSGEAPVYLLEITHPQLSVPIRVVADNQDLTHLGNTFSAFAFDLTLPDDMAGKLPRGELRLDNVGRELTQWLEASQGGRGADVRIITVMRDAPDTIEDEITCDLLGVKQDVLDVRASVGYDDMLNRQALVMRYDPSVAPGLF